MARSHPRTRSVGPASVAGLVAVLALLGAVLAFPSVHSAFSATTGTPANSLAADRLSPPSGLVATQSCATSPVVLRGAAASTAFSPLVLSTPAGTQPGDVLLAQVVHYGAATIEAPSSWNRVLGHTSGGLVTSTVYWKVATAAEPAASFSRPSTSSGDMVGGIVAYRGVDQGDPVAVADGTTGLGVTATTPALTTTATGAVVVHLLAKQGAQLLTPTGTRALWALSSDSEGATAADEPFAGPGTTASRTTTTAGDPPAATEWIAQTVVLRRAPGTPSVSLAWTGSASTWATGYRLERSVAGTVQASAAINPVGTTSTTDGPLVNRTTYTWSLRAYRGTWTSSAVTTTLTPSC